MKPYEQLKEHFSFPFDPHDFQEEAIERMVCVKQVVASVKDLLIFPPNFLMASDG